MARLYPEDVRDDCLYSCTVSFDGGDDLWTAHRITARRGNLVRVMSPDETGPAEIRVQRVTDDAASRRAVGDKFRSKSGTLFYSPELTRDLLAWQNKMRRDASVTRATRELAEERRLFELGDRLDFLEYQPGILKMRGFDVYAAAWDGEPGGGDVFANIIEGHPGEFRRCIVGNLDEARRWTATEDPITPALFLVKQLSD